jgi:hypothetical protein
MRNLAASRLDPEQRDVFGFNGGCYYTRVGYSNILIGMC